MPSRFLEHQLLLITTTMSRDELRMLRNVLRNKYLALSVLEHDHEKLRVNPQNGHDRERVQRLRNEAEQEEARKYLLRMVDDLRGRIKKVSGKELPPESDFTGTRTLVNRIDVLIDRYENAQA